MRSTQLEQLLPECIRAACGAGTPLSALLAAMADMLTPVTDVLDRIDTYFDPVATPRDFVPYLAMWMDLDALLDATASRSAGVASFPTGTARLRALVARSAYLAKWRGTARGMLELLEVATGVKGFRIQENPGDLNFHIDLLAPLDLQPYAELIEAIAGLEKPAYVTCRVIFQ